MRLLDTAGGGNVGVVKNFVDKARMDMMTSSGGPASLCGVPSASHS